MGTTNTPWEKAAEAKLISLWRRGWTGDKIATALKVSRSAVMGKAARLGLYRQEKRKTARVGILPPTNPRMSSAVARGMISSLPPDGRTPIQRLLGDPPPGRSALDKSKEQTKTTVRNPVAVVASLNLGEFMEDRHSNSEAVE